MTAEGPRSTVDQPPERTPADGIVGHPTPDEAAAVAAALAAIVGRFTTADEAEGYERWRRTRLAAIRARRF